MSSVWLFQRFRSEWVSANLSLIVLRALRRSSMTEWEVLAAIHAAYGFSPRRVDFGNLKSGLVQGGFVRISTEGHARRIEMTKTGGYLLDRLEAEYEALTASAADS